MSFVKLDCGLLDSTLWIDRLARELFITALLMAEPHELKIPMRQLQVRELSETGFEIPEGWYGFIAAAGTGIIHRAGLSQEEGLCALERLGSEDPESRSPEWGGRRLIRVDGGYILLNFIKYREKDATSAERSKRWRERQRLKAVSTRVADTPTRVIRHQAEAEAEAEAKGEGIKEKKGLRPPEAFNLKQMAAKEVLDYLNQKTGVSMEPDKSVLDYIVKRLGGTYSISDLKLVIDDKCKQWLHVPEMKPQLIPATLFGNKFPQYVATSKASNGVRAKKTDAEYAEENRKMLEARSKATEAES